MTVETKTINGKNIVTLTMTKDEAVRLGQFCGDFSPEDEVNHINALRNRNMLGYKKRYLKPLTVKNWGVTDAVFTQLLPLFVEKP